MTIKKSIMFFAAAICFSLPVHAETLADATMTITNNTDFDSSSIINGGSCSDKLGQSGITRAHSTNKVPDKLVKLSCLRSPHNCTAVVYMSAHCTGPAVFTVVLDVDKGIQSATPIDPKRNRFTITFNKFAVTMTQK